MWLPVPNDWSQARLGLLALWSASAFHMRLADQIRYGKELDIFARERADDANLEIEHSPRAFAIRIAEISELVAIGLVGVTSLVYCGSGKGKNTNANQDVLWNFMGFLTVLALLTQFVTMCIGFSVDNHCYLEDGKLPQGIKQGEIACKMSDHDGVDLYMKERMDFFTLAPPAFFLFVVLGYSYFTYSEGQAFVGTKRMV